MFDLTSFQRDILYVACGADEPSGQAIKAELETDDETITHGRLYPNLDTLVDEGYLEKGQRDRRTNVYTVSETGREKLQARRRWEDEYVTFD
ncbi:PadR family transcriptional regulator [Halovenus carboxidivorans]|uniref:PadR family transcriptional regulator n=1 Tax=Halovenus carboxidivorans TaxID=2692199 RepID=UPI001916C9E7|nr:PadR family transcriptional regulator [Halovenus carboxidivorans]